MLSLIEIDKKITPALFGDDEDKFAWYEDFVEDYWLDILKNPEHFQDTVEAMIAIFSTPEESMLEQSSNDMIVQYWFLLTKDNDDLFDITQTDDWYKLQKISLYLLLKTAEYQKNNPDQHSFYDENTKSYLESRLNDFPETCSASKDFILKEVLTPKEEPPVVEVQKPKRQKTKATQSSKLPANATLEEQIVSILNDTEAIIAENKSLETELDTLQSEFDQVVAERDSLKIESEELQAQIVKLELEVSRLQGEIISRFFKLPV